MKVASRRWRRILGLLAVENLLDGEDLQAGIGAAVGGFVEAGFGGFAEHGFGGFFEAEEDADLGFFALEDADEVADLGDGDAAGLDGKDDLLGLAGVVVVEVEAAVDAAVGALLLLGGTRARPGRAPTIGTGICLRRRVAPRRRSRWVRR